MIFDKSLDIFEECVKQISRVVSKEKENAKQISNLSKLYSIAFIKIYLNKFVEFEFSQKYNHIEINNIFDRINTGVNKNTSLDNVLKIYIIKILYNLNNRNFEKLFEYDLIQNKGFKNIQINTQYFLINYFIPLDKNDENEFKHGMEVYLAMIDKDNKKENEEKQNDKVKKDGQKMKKSKMIR